jgi:hypothetical protein
MIMRIADWQAVVALALSAAMTGCGATRSAAQPAPVPGGNVGAAAVEPSSVPRPAVREPIENLGTGSPATSTAVPPTTPLPNPRTNAP